MTVPEILFFAILAGFILYKLYTVLGRDDFNHPQQPPKNKPTSTKAGSGAGSRNKVVDFPGVKRCDERPKETTLDKRRKIHEPEITDAEILKQLENIQQYEGDFTAGTFLVGAKTAFEMVVSAFSKEDDATLKSLLSSVVYKSFAEEMSHLKDKGYSSDTTLVSILDATITEVQIVRKKARITVGFTSEQIYQLKDKEGELIEGSPSEIEVVKDVWQFEHNLQSDNPNWTIIST